MMGTKERLISGDEWDCLTRGRRYENKRAGKFRIIKAKFWRRVRKQARLRAVGEALS
jgi:hypothetical protein